jgi:hypothetical protein
MMAEQSSGAPKQEGAVKGDPKKANPKKASVAPIPHDKGKFARSQWKGKEVVGRPLKHSGR